METHNAINAEARSIIAAGRRLGAEVTIEDGDTTTSITINVGNAGWLTVHYIRDFWTNRVRRVGASAIIAHRDGTNARKVNPANQAEIADVLGRWA